MAKLECLLVNIFAEKKRLDDLLLRLQEMSVMDISTAAIDEQTSFLPAGYERQDKSGADVYEKYALSADNAIKIINEKYPEKKSIVDMFSDVRSISREDFYIGNDAFLSAASLVENIHEKVRTLAETAAEKVRIRTSVDTLRVWQPLDVPLSFKGTESTGAFIGTVAGQYNLEDLLCALAEKVSDADIYGEVIDSDKDSTYIFICCKREAAQDCENALRTLGFARPVHSGDTTAAEQIAILEEKLDECEKAQEKCEEELLELSKRRREIEVFADYSRTMAERLKTSEEVIGTEHTVLIRGYVAKVDFPVLEKELNKEFCVVIESEKANEELAPVKLKNNAFASPAETITQMYSLPSHTDIDPSPLTGFFYYLLFGMMLSDAGYGLLMVIGTLLVLKKFNPSPSMKKSMQLFLYCGISTVFWGLLFGSFFGDSVAVISRTFFHKEISLPALIDPMNGGAVTLLILSLAIGMAQIIAGLCAKFVTCIKNGDKAGAFFDAGLWITTLLGITLLAVGIFAFPILKTIGMWVAIASVVGLILTQGRHKKGFVMKIFSGIASLYDITGYVSDLLSFSRLMALGLTTAAMGAVFNLLGTLGGSGIGGIITMLIIFPVGHAISFALNALGAYVHTLRLQYVELFSKFYDGGGREFKTFKLKNKYVGVTADKEEIL